MNVGLGFNPAGFSRASAGPTQSQVNAQAAAGSGNSFAHDSVVRSNQRRASLQMVGVNMLGTRRVLDRAGVTKIAGAKRGR